MLERNRVAVLSATQHWVDFRRLIRNQEAVNWLSRLKGHPYWSHSKIFGATLLVFFASSYHRRAKPAQPESRVQHLRQRRAVGLRTRLETLLVAFSRTSSPATFGRTALRKISRHF
jgi:hypothetical protein